MPHIFISYRRVDSQAMTSLIYRSLVQEYGEKSVFMDTKAITSGQWWAQVQAALARADVVIVIVGPKWETEIQNRLNNGDDYVREEVRIALELKKPIILAFVDGENGIDPLRLPDDIRELPKYQGYQILHEPFFDASIELLKENIPKIKRNLFSPFSVALLTLLLAVIVGLVVVISNNLNTGNPTIVSQNTPDNTEISTQTSQATDTLILPTPTIDGVYVADGYDLPIGTAEERAGDEILPTGWIDATGFATMLGGTAYNTGADLNLGSSNEDLGMPVYAIASGEVIFQSELPVWGNITIIRHDPLFTPDGIVAYSRYSATRNMIVAVGERVSRGQKIGEIGNSNGRTAAYLNFDISTTTILEEDTRNYPRLDLDYLLENYVDPLEFIRNNRPIRNIACVLTPYDGKTLIWHWKGDTLPEQSIAEFATNLRQNAPNVAGVIVKVADGTDWQGVFDSSALAINGTDDLAEWVSVLETHGLELHIWAVPNKLDASPDLLASAANVAGVKSLILDVEPYTGFWEGSEAEVTAFVAVLRARITNPDFHISISVDPRPQHYESIFPEAWRPFINSVHLQLFWTTFRQIPEDTIQVAWETWGDYGLPLIPVLLSDAPLSEQQVAFNNLTDTPLNVAGMTWWRAGAISDYDVVNQLPTINCP